MNILQKIFKEHYEEIEYTLHPRPVVMENIEKMVNCGNPSYGGAMYGCPHCGELKFVPFRCHSKFCSTCGNKYCIDRSSKMASKLIPFDHRHLVFTIDEDLRQFFLDDRSLLDCLFQAVRSVILEMFHKLNKKKNFVPGFVCVLHTFGRPLEWNSYVERTVPVMDFIKLLIQHIPEKHFKMTRYYGLYARHREIDQSLRKAVPKPKHRILLNFNTWRNLIILSFGYAPLQCPKCNHMTKFLELYHNHERVSLEELYERTMAKHRPWCRSSGKCA